MRPWIRPKLIYELGYIDHERKKLINQTSSQSYPFLFEKHVNKMKSKSHIGRKYLLNTYLVNDWYPEYMNNSHNSIRKETTQF